MAQLTNVDLSIDGQQVRRFQHLNINQNIYAIDNIHIMFRNDALEESDTFLIENSKDFIGKTFTITSEITEYGNTEPSEGFSYQGIITRIEGQRTASMSGDIISLTGNSPDIVLKGKPIFKTFHEKTLGDIVNEILQAYPRDILNPTVSPRNTDTLPYIVQYLESDYEFIHRLARKFGEWFFWDGQALHFGELPDIEDKELVLGVGLDSFNFSLQTVPSNFSLGHVENAYVDESFSFESGSNNVDQQVNEYARHAYQESDNMYSEAGRRMYSHFNRPAENLQQALDSAGYLEEIADISDMSDVTATGSNKLIKLGQVVDIIHPAIDDNPERNYGRYRLTSLSYQCDHMMNYSNSFNGMQAGIEIPENADINAIRISRPVRGIVVENEDPDHMGRVKVDFTLRSNDEDRTPWIRCATNYACGEGGNFFVPEMYSEVIVGFVDGDVDQPYVMGQFFSTDVRPFNPLGDWAGQSADIKAIRTRTGHTIEFHDIDGGEQLRIYDQNNNSEILLDTANNELKITSQGTLKLEAQDIEMTAQNGIKIEATSDLEMSGANVEISASSNFKAEASASAEVSSSGIMTVSGSLVQIN